MHRLGGIDEDRGLTGRSHRRGYLTTDETGLTDAHHHYFAFTGKDRLYYLIKTGIDGLTEFLQFGYLFAKNLLCSLCVCHLAPSFLACSISMAVSSSSRISLRRTWLAASEMAFSGSGCVSMNSPSTPTATAARMR